MERHFMLDLETLSTRSNAAILSIGMVEFDPFLTGIWTDQNIKNEVDRLKSIGFYKVTNLNSCLELGLHVDQSTVEWWGKQSKEARSEVFNPTVSHHISTALSDLMLHISKAKNEGDEVIIWSNGASFDIPIIENAFKQAGLPIPWEYSGSRCYRTIRSLAKAINPEGFNETEETEIPDLTSHNALHDAIYQAIKLYFYFIALEGFEIPGQKKASTEQQLAETFISVTRGFHDLFSPENPVNPTMKERGDLQ